jgi:hypothetical protein
MFANYRNDVKKNIREWRGKEILILNNLEYKFWGQDTLCLDVWGSHTKSLLILIFHRCFIDFFYWDKNNKVQLIGHHVNNPKM